MAHTKKPPAPVLLDDIDLLILEQLQRSSKITNAMLSERIGISPPSTLERVRKLENGGVISGYVALLDPEKLNKAVRAIVHVKLNAHSRESLSKARTTIAKLDDVLNCWYTAGEEDFILEVLVSDMNDYERFVSDRLSAVPGIATIRTAFVLNTVKQSTGIPLDAVAVRRRNARNRNGQ